MFSEVLCLCIDVVPSFLKCHCNSCQYFFPRGSIMHWPWREISSAIKRFSCWCKKNIQRPSPATGHSLHSIHIDMIEVGSFFSIDLNIDKKLIHCFCGDLIFKALLFHYMAPMTGCVAN